MIKAFNNIIALSLAGLGRPEGSSDRIAIAVAGDDQDAKRVVMSIVDDVGFDQVDVGGLQESWRQEAATPAYCCDYDAVETRKGLAAAETGKARAKLARLPEVFAKLDANPSHADVIAANRALNAPRRKRSVIVGDYPSPTRQLRDRRLRPVLHCTSRT